MTKMRSAIRTGQFKNKLLSEDFLISEKMQSAIQDIRRAETLSQEKKLAEYEWTALYIFILSAHRRPHDFLGGPHNQNFFLGAKGVLLCEDLKSIFSLSIFEKLSSEQNFFDFFCSRSLRSIPLSVQKSLAAWALGQYPLKLRSDIPSPLEILQMQSHGMRCVSVLTSQAQMLTYVEGSRDVLGFVVHDLIHADHFFRDKKLAQAQIHFSQKLTCLDNLSLVQKLKQQDSEFLFEWNYLISDMNSVPLHLLKSLKAIFLGYFKRRAGIHFRESLGSVDEQEFQQLLLNLAKELGLNLLQTEAWLRLNGASFKMPQDALTLQEALQIS